MGIVVLSKIRSQAAARGDSGLMVACNILAASIPPGPVSTFFLSGRPENFGAAFTPYRPGNVLKLG
jgi:hypothetical protein